MCMYVINLSFTPFSPLPPVAPLSPLFSHSIPLPFPLKFFSPVHLLPLFPSLSSLSLQSLFFSAFPTRLLPPTSISPAPPPSVSPSLRLHLFSKHVKL